MEIENNKISISKKLILVSSFLVIFVLISSVGFAWAYSTSYDGKVYPGVKIASYDVGGLSRNEVVSLIENLNNRYADEGISLKVANYNKGSNEITINTIVSGEAAIESVKLDSEAIADEALKVGRQGNELEKILRPLSYRFLHPEIRAKEIINETVLKSILEDSLRSFEDKIQNASLNNVTASGEVEILEEKGGLGFNYEDVIEKIRKSIVKLSFSPVEIQLINYEPTLFKAEVASIAPKLVTILDGSIILSQENSTSTIWILDSEQLASMIDVKESENQPIFYLNKEKFDKYMEINVLPVLETPAADAKFTIENNKVKEFKASRDGITIDVDKAYLEANKIIEDRNFAENSTTTILLTTKTLEAKIKTADLNTFGIVELIGTGSSTFKDSHTNRIKNIAHAVEILNGTLIQPGKEFSATKYAGPFTAENGYLPEQIIKGREIRYEVGGGMCQIGTTLFRMAMQSGMPITERHNHSLVVNYYADPVNGNPGTDATLYEPILDFKFLNDTGNYLLLTTEIDYKKQLLNFSLWGTKDGRSGSYTRPKVSRWISPPKEVEYIPSTTLKPGAQSCQTAYRGAVASFTYTRVTPQGEKIERVFDSYYRPLPKICKVGPTSTPAIAPTTTAPTNSSTTPASY